MFFQVDVIGRNNHAAYFFFTNVVVRILHMPLYNFAGAYCVGTIRWKGCSICCRYYHSARVKGKLCKKVIKKMFSNNSRHNLGIKVHWGLKNVPTNDNALETV
jgi:hypothetical protein